MEPRMTGEEGHRQEGGFEGLLRSSLLAKSRALPPPRLGSLFPPFPPGPKTVRASALAPASMPHIGHTIPLHPYSSLSVRQSLLQLALRISGTPPENGGYHPT